MHCEDLVSAPEQKCAVITAFLRVPFMPKMTRPGRSGRVGQQFHAPWGFVPISAQSVDVFQQMDPRDDPERGEDIATGLMQRFSL